MIEASRNPVSDPDVQDGERLVRRLRDQADRCVELATKAFHPRMFQKYVDLAATYRQEAEALERSLGLAEGRAFKA